MGGGVVQIFMPAIMDGFTKSGSPLFSAWRWAFFVPGAIFLVMGAVTFMFAQVRYRRGRGGG